MKTILFLTGRVHYSLLSFYFNVSIFNFIAVNSQDGGPVVAEGVEATNGNGTHNATAMDVDGSPVVKSKIGKLIWF